MAIWHFKVDLLPKKGIIRELKSIPKYLEEYKENFIDPEKHIDDYFLNYWESCNIKKIEKEVAIILPSLESWSDSLALYGHDKRGTTVEIWDDDIHIKFDTRKPDYSFLKAIVRIAQDSDSLFIVEETGKLIEPVFEEILELFQKSRAYRFSNNSDIVLEEETSA